MKITERKNAAEIVLNKKAEDLKKQYMELVGFRLIEGSHVDLDAPLYTDKENTEIDCNWALEQDIKRQYRELVNARNVIIK